MSRDDYPEELMQFLSESPVGRGNADQEPPLDLLWATKWGVEQGRLRLLEDIIRAMRDSSGPYNVMVTSDYGTGKTSLLRRLRHRLLAQKDDKGEGVFITLWLDMPSLTGTTPALTHALVMAAIVDKLMGEGCGGTIDPEWQTDVREIWELDKAMYAHTNGQSSPCPFGTNGSHPPEDSREECREEPRRSSLSGGGTTPERVLRATRLEKKIRGFLRGNHPRPRHLVVFLDDLDRCQKFIPYHVIRLLLRFGGMERVHFMLACDEDIMAAGAKQWMECHGHGFGDRNTDQETEDKQTSYSPASTLRKYIALRVELPGLGVARPDKDVPILDWLRSQGAGARAQKIEDILRAYADITLGNARESDSPPQEAGPRKAEKLLGDNYLSVFLATLLEHTDAEEVGDIRVEDDDKGSSGKVGEAVPIQEKSVKSSNFDDKSAGKEDLADKSVGKTLVLASRPYMFLDRILQHDPKKGGWEASSIVKTVSRFLTLRQIKSWFRHMLMESSRESDFLLELREQNFPWLRELQRKNDPGYRYLRMLSTSLNHMAEMNLWGAADSYFVEQLDGILRANDMPYGALDVWPRKHTEQRLLLAILAHSGEPYDPYTSTDTQETIWEPRFDAFCEKWFQRRIAGSPDEKISQLDDTIRASPAIRQQAQEILKEYSLHILPLHQKFMSQKRNVFLSLSNLGVLLEDSLGAEAGAAALFEASLHRGGDARICNNYVEFLLGCLTDDNRLQFLSEYAPFRKDTKKAAQDRITELLKKISTSSDPVNAFRRRINLFQLDNMARLEPGENLLPRIRTMVQEMAPQIVQDLYGAGGSQQVILRLDAFLDRMLGTADDLLNERTALLMPFWRIAEFGAENCPKYPQYQKSNARLLAVRLLANNLVGQSANGSPGEAAGVRLSRYLLGLKTFVRSNLAYSSQIFTQVMVTLDEHEVTDLSKRVALCALAAWQLLPDADANAQAKWLDRVTKAWKHPGVGSRPNKPDDILPVLVSKVLGEKELLVHFEAWLSNPEDLDEPPILSAIFGTEFEPIESCEAFAEAIGWPAALWAQMEEDAEHICRGTQPQSGASA